MRNLSLLLMIGLVVLSACGVREQPLTGEVTPTPVASATSAPPGPSAAPAPDRTSGAVPIATPETTTTALPMITSQVVLAGRPAAPGTLLLRDAWDTRSPPDTVAQTLLYSFLDYDRRPASAPSAFYQLTLGDAPTKTEIVRIPNSGLEEPTYGYLSPDGQYIAYLVHLDGNRAILRMMRVDGSEDRFITDRVFIAGLSINCSTNVSWSPDSTQIAFHRYNPTAPTLDTQRQIGVYQINSPSEPVILAEYRWSLLIGWKTNRLSRISRSKPYM